MSAEVGMVLMFTSAPDLIRNMAAEVSLRRMALCSSVLVELSEDLYRALGSHPWLICGGGGGGGGNSGSWF